MALVWSQLRGQTSVVGGESSTSNINGIVLMQLLTAATTPPVSDSNFLSNLRFVFINQT